MQFKKGQDLELEIHDLAFGGKGISRIETEQGKYVIFIQGTIPGQTVLARVTKKRRKHAEARLMKTLKSSPLEKEIPHQKISGAPYITLPLEDQIKFKTSSSLDLFRKIGYIEHPDSLLDEYVESPLDYFYRNKMEYSFSSIRHDIHTNEEVDNFALGFKHKGTWWKVENLDLPSGLFDESWESKLHELRKWFESTGLPAWHPPGKYGFYRHLVVRKSFAQDKLLINLVTSSEDLEKFDQQEFVNQVLDLHGERIAGIIHTVNESVADRAKLEHGPSDIIYGEPTVVESILGLDFEISMQSFFQTNPKCAEKLYKKTIAYAKEKLTKESGNVVMDLFCGTGTIGQILASELENTEIIGVDIVASAIENAKINAAKNNLEKAKFFAADVGKFLIEYPEYKNKIDLIILDPPRAGIVPKALKRVIELNADGIVYISCNPATQARDCATLQQNGYELEKFSFVDQFPHTAHLESIMVFNKVN